MHSHRLARLSLLTQGIALVGIGFAEFACSKDAPKEELHINAPPTPTVSATEVVTPPLPNSADPNGQNRVHVNSPPPPTPSASGSSGVAPKTNPVPVRTPPHVNSVPRQMPVNGPPEVG